MSDPTSLTKEDRVGTLWERFDDREKSFTRAHTEELFNIITDLRASLRREENARKIAEKDAERYRWWRRYVFHDRDPLDSIAEAESLEELDAAIDAEMGKQS